MRNVIVGCLITAVLSLALGYMTGWKRANDTAALKEAAVALQNKTLSDSLREVITKRQIELNDLGKKSDSASANLRQQIAKARAIISDLRSQTSTDTPSTLEMKAIAACSMVFNTCEQTADQLQRETIQAKSQIASLYSKLRSDSLRYENERRAWARREASLTVGRNYGTIGKTVLMMGAACYVSHMRK